MVPASATGKHFSYNIKPVLKVFVEKLFIKISIQVKMSAYTGTCFMCWLFPLAVQSSFSLFDVNVIKFING